MIAVARSEHAFRIAVAVDAAERRICAKINIRKIHTIGGRKPGDGVVVD